MPYTKGSSLKRRLQEAEDKALGNRLSGRIRVLERLGRTVKETIANPTPWKSDPCGRNCNICQEKQGLVRPEVWCIKYTVRSARRRDSRACT